METLEIRKLFLYTIPLCVLGITICSTAYGGITASKMNSDLQSIKKSSILPKMKNDLQNMEKSPIFSNGYNSSKKSKVVIIGAGLSGLTMGYRLLNKGYSVSLYEARPRVGGRVHSVYVKNSFDTYSIAELGGQNITDGGKANYFLNLAKEFNLEIEDDPRHLSRGFYSDKEIYDPVKLLKKNGLTQIKLDQNLTTFSSKNINMEDVLENFFANNLILKRNFSYYIGSYEGLPCSNLSIVHNIDTLRYFLPGGGAASADNVETNKPFLLKHIRGGNSQLPLAMAQALENRIFTNKVLQKVSRSNEEIKLKFIDGEIIYCDKLIFSNPCGTFKDISFEESVIPKERLEVFHKVQYGLNGKIFIPNTKSTNKPLYNSINNDHLGFFQNGDYKLLVGYTDGIWGDTLTKNIDIYYPQVLEMAEVNYGKLERSSLTLPGSVSEEVFKKYNGPIFKSWAEDPYAKGAYATVGTKLGEKFLEKTLHQGTWFRTIFTPIDEKIFFIGEHTSIIEESGTMEAALESAERLAKIF